MPNIILLLTFRFEIQIAEKNCDTASELPLWPSSYFSIILASYMNMDTDPKHRHPDWYSYANQEPTAMSFHVSSYCVAPRPHPAFVIYIPSEL